MNRPSMFAIVSLCLALFAGGAVFGQAVQAPYTEGSVWQLQLIRTKSGFTDDYLKSLGTTWKRVADEQKRAGNILSYKVMRSAPGSREDWDVLLMIEYKNHAALDGIDGKFRAIAAKVVGNDDAQRSLATKRLDIREVVGTRLAQEISLR